MSKVCAPEAAAGQLAHAHRRHAVVLIDDGDLQVLDVAAERVAEHDQLHDREDQRHDDQHRAAPEPPQLALDDGPGASHRSAPPRDEAGAVHRRRPAARRAGRGRCSARTRRRASCSAPTATATGAAACCADSISASRRRRSVDRWRCGRRGRRRSRLRRTAGPAAAPASRLATSAKLTSSTFLPGIDAFSFSGESSAFSSP